MYFHLVLVYQRMLNLQFLILLHDNFSVSQQRKEQYPVCPFLYPDSAQLCHFLSGQLANQCFIY